MYRKPRDSRVIPVKLKRRKEQKNSLCDKIKVAVSRLKQNSKGKTFKMRMELQISYSICTEIQEKRLAIGKILRNLCEWKGVKIIEAEVCPDHVHMLLEIPPK